MICLLVMTDGRDELLLKTIGSAAANLWGPITRTVIHTDAGKAHAVRLREDYPMWDVIGGDRLGFGGAIDRAWRKVSQFKERFVFHLEDDFTFNRRIDLDAMARVMDSLPYIVQLALRRQPWNEAEKLAGGIVEQWPNEYQERSWLGHTWLEHRLFLSTNPALWRMEFVRQGWPVCDRSEAVYSERVFRDPEMWSAFWGARGSGEAVTHIGEQRVGTNY